jgi:hypothetical protein
MLLGDGLRRKIWGARLLLNFADTAEYIVDTKHFTDVVTPIPDPRQNDPTRMLRVSRRDYTGAKYARIKRSRTADLNAHGTSLDIWRTSSFGTA